MFEMRFSIQYQGMCIFLSIQQHEEAYQRSNFSLKLPKTATFILIFFNPATRSSIPAVQLKFKINLQKTANYIPCLFASH